MDSNELKKWILNHNIKNRTVEGFWNYLNNYRMDDPDSFFQDYGEIDMNLIDTKISTISLTVNYNFDGIVEFVTCFLRISYKGEEVGEYESLFTLNGEDLDDYLRIAIAEVKNKP